MSLQNQRLTNYFPRWTKIRKDPSSLGARTLSVFSEGLETLSNISMRYKLNHFLSTPNLSRSFLWAVVLEESFTKSALDNGYSWNYPMVIGITNSEEFPITRTDKIDDFNSIVPTRLTLKRDAEIQNKELYSSENGISSFNEFADRLAIVVKNSTYFVNKTPERDKDKSGRSCIHIKGYDEFYNVVEEIINIIDDDLYYSFYAYRELISVDVEGFDGNITIQLGDNSSADRLMNSFYSLISKDVEGPLYLRIENNKLYFETKIVKEGRFYIEDNLENIETVFSSVLLDSEGETINVVSYALSPLNNYLYVLDDENKIHIYEYDFPEFLPYISESTQESYIELTPLSFYPEYNREESLWTFLARNRYPITQVSIKRTDPDGNVHWLQNDLSWGVSEPVAIDRRYSNGTFKPWTDFKFSTLYDKYGQWEYTIYTTTTMDKTQYTIAVFCSFHEASNSIQLDNDTLERIGFDQFGQLYVETNSYRYLLNEHLDVYIADEERNRIFLSDEYEQISVEF